MNTPDKSTPAIPPAPSEQQMAGGARKEHQIETSAPTTDEVIAREAAKEIRQTHYAFNPDVQMVEPLAAIILKAMQRARSTPSPSQDTEANTKDAIIKVLVNGIECWEARRNDPKETLPGMTAGEVSAYYLGHQREAERICDLIHAVFSGKDYSWATACKHAARNSPSSHRREIR